MKPQPLAIATASLGLTASIASLVLPAATMADKPAEASGTSTHRSTITTQEVAMVSPALERYTQSIVRGDLRKRPDLSPRDRAIVTLAALIARSHTVAMSSRVALARAEENKTKKYK
jgi:4-carboxymuconolactone decarboxylase